MIILVFYKILGGEILDFLKLIPWVGIPFKSILYPYQKNIKADKIF
jgi:hypothetical protein